MSPITKEWLQKTITSIESARDEIPFGLDEDQSNMLTAFKIALASLELERGIIRRFDLDMSGCDSCGQDCGADMIEDLDGEYVLWDEVLPHLYRYGEYTATPAQVSVPAAMEMDDDFDSAFEHGKAVGWNAYRAAMLQSFGNSEQLNSPVIPNGYVLVPKEITCAMDDAAWEAYHETRCMSDIWAALLAAAPQQEVKP